MDKQNLSPDFEISIKFDKNKSPAQAFRVLSDLIDAFSKFDKDLLCSIDTKIEPTIILEDLEVGSIKAWFANKLKTIDDDGIKELDWKKLVGSYLVKSKYLLINWLEDKTEVTDRKDIKKLEDDLFKLAKETDIKRFPSYTPIPTAKLISNIKNITTAVQSFEDGEIVYSAIKEEKEAKFNLEFSFSPEGVIDLLTKNTFVSSSTMLLKVKRPDYLGLSKWDLRHGRTPIEAKISDEQWLEKFQNREINVRPGDSLKADVEKIDKYDYDNELIGVDFNIIKVHDVIEVDQSNQISLDESDESNDKED